MPEQTSDPASRSSDHLPWMDHPNRYPSAESEFDTVRSVGQEVRVTRRRGSEFPKYEREVEAILAMLDRRRSGDTRTTVQLRAVLWGSETVQ